MKTLVIMTPGGWYKTKSIHFVDPAQAEKIRKACNDCKYNLLSDERWTVLNIPDKEAQYTNAMTQSFRITNNEQLQEIRYIGRV